MVASLGLFVRGTSLRTPDTSGKPPTHDTTLRFAAVMGSPFQRVPYHGDGGFACCKGNAS